MSTQEFSPEFRWATACKLRFDAALLEYGACCAIGNDAMVQRAATGAIQALAIKLDADWQQARLAFGHPPPEMPVQAAIEPGQQPNGSAPPPETAGKRKGNYGDDIPSPGAMQPAQGGEIEITPAMVERGVAFLREFMGDEYPYQTVMRSQEAEDAVRGLTSVLLGRKASRKRSGRAKAPESSAPVSESP